MKKLTAAEKRLLLWKEHIEYLFLLQGREIELVYLDDGKISLCSEEMMPEDFSLN